MFVLMRNQSITKTNMYSSQKMSLLSNLKYVTLHSKISGIAGFKKIIVSICHHPSFLFHTNLQNKLKFY